jgi:hypothetical protein
MSTLLNFLTNEGLGGLKSTTVANRHNKCEYGFPCWLFAMGNLEKALEQAGAGIASKQKTGKDSGTTKRSSGGSFRFP